MSYFDPSIFWEGWKATQNFNQTMFNFLDTIWKHQKTKNSASLMGEFIQEFVSYVSYNAAIANKLFSTLPRVHSHEDLTQLQEQIISEYSQKNVEIIKKIFSMLHQLMQDNYQYTKQQAADFANHCQATYKDTMENLQHRGGNDKMSASNCCHKTQSKPNHDKKV